MNLEDLELLESMAPRKSSIDPLISSADIIVKLQNPAARKRLDRDQVQRDLRAQADNLVYDNLSQLEAMLGAQAHVLHAIFTGATERYAEADTPEKAELYSRVACKAQNYCRLTVAAIARIKKSNENNAPERHIAKMKNELMFRSPPAWQPPLEEKYHGSDAPLPAYADEPPLRQRVAQG